MASPRFELGYLRMKLREDIRSATRYIYLHIITSADYNDQDLKDAFKFNVSLMRSYPKKTSQHSTTGLEILLIVYIYREYLKTNSLPKLLELNWNWNSSTWKIKFNNSEISAVKIVISAQPFYLLLIYYFRTCMLVHYIYWQHMYISLTSNSIRINQSVWKILLVRSKSFLSN